MWCLNMFTIYCLKITFFFLGLCFWQSHTDLINLCIWASHISHSVSERYCFLFSSRVVEEMCFGVVRGHPESYHFSKTNVREVIGRVLCTWWHSWHLGKSKQLWYRRRGGGKAFINSIIGVQSGIKYDHFCPYATHFIYITVKSVQGPNIF